MRMVTCVIALSAAMAASAASAQGVDLNGRFVCIQNCATTVPGHFAFVTQNGWDLNLVNEAGVPSRAWIKYPGRLWVDQPNTGAVYSPDGMTIQFDNGTIWHRALDVPRRIRVRR